MRTRSRHGFTLIELIVTIVILGVLAALSVPAFRAVIDRSADQVVIAALEAIDREARLIRAYTLDASGPLTGDEAADLKSDTRSLVVGEPVTYAADMSSVALDSTSGDCWQLTFAADVDGPGEITSVPDASAQDGICQS